MPISTMLSGKLISVGTSLFMVLGSGHYDLDQIAQEADIAVPATTQITAAMPVNSVPSLHKSTFEMRDYIHTMFNPYNWNQLDYAKWWMEDEREELLLEYCGTFGVSEEEVQLLLEVGYDPDEIEELLMDTVAMKEAISEAKTLLQCEA